MKTKSLLKSCVLISVLMPAVSPALTPAPTTFPKLLGMQIGAANYDNVSYQQQMAQFDVVILSFPNNWSTPTFTVRAVVQALKALNPNILVGQYSILDAAHNNGLDPDISNTLNANNWWLKDESGAQLQKISDVNNWNINYTAWTQFDANGNQYPQWYAQRTYNNFFSLVPELDIWYFDDVTQKPSNLVADWKQQGASQFNTDIDVQTAHYNAHAAEWSAAQLLAPNLIQMGSNVDNDLSIPQWNGKLGAAYLEGIMGLNWSIENSAGWVAMMQRYYNTVNNTVAPHIIGFNVQNDPTNYSFFRYAYASCLMNNGYFSFTDPTVGYSSIAWFDEYNVKLGTAIDTPPRVDTLQVVKRHFQNGMVIVNPTTSTVNVPVESGYSHFVGQQDPVTNDGSAVNGSITMPAKSGIVLIQNH